MSFSENLKMERLFGGEVEDRSGALVAGARALAADDVTEALFDEMCREGHTIKGTARMMGYTAVSDAGKLLEEAWKELRDGDQLPTPALADALEVLSRELFPAATADPTSGTPQLAAGMRAVRRALRGEPPVVEVNQDEEPVERSAPNPDDLGGLLGTLDSRAFGESVRVNAAGLFRLINGISSLRVDAEAVQGEIQELGEAVDADARVPLDRIEALVASVQKDVMDLQGRAVDLAAAPLTEITSTYPQLVRYLARKAGKDVRFELVGDHHAVDRQVLERLSDPLRQLLVNAIEHGIEPMYERESLGKPQTARLAVGFDVVDHRLTIVVEDDGSGIDWARVRDTAERSGLLTGGELADPEALRTILFSQRFSTAQPSDLVGEGMGLATVAETVEALHGTFVLDSEAGSGTRLTITVPTSHALQDALLIRSAGQTWGISEIAVLEKVAAPPALSESGSSARMIWNGTSIPVTSFAETVGLRSEGEPEWVLVVSSPFGPLGLAVEEVVGRRQVAARELGPVLDGAPHLTGAALLGGGDIVVLVDAARLADRARAVPDTDPTRRRVFVVDDSRGARQIVGGALSSAGFEVDLAGSPTEALSVLADQHFDAIVLDYVLPTMDGATLAGRVRDLGVQSPIVVLSGMATAADQEKAIAAGANVYLDKDDVRKGALAKVIRELIEYDAPESAVGMS